MNYRVPISFQLRADSFLVSFGWFNMSTGQWLCELCDDREVAFWYNDCQQWVCPLCKRSHLKTRATKDHDVTPLTLKIEQIKRDVRQNATPVRQRAATMTSHVDQLQQALEKLDVKQAEFLKQSDDLRQKYVQKINDHFDTLNTEAINIIHKEAATVRNRKQEAEKSLEAVSSRLQTLEELLADNSPRLAVQGKKILEDLATFQEAPFNGWISEPELSLEVTKPFQVRAVIVKTVWEKPKSDKLHIGQDVLKLSRLRESRFVEREVAELVSCPLLSMNAINDDIWTCHCGGTIVILSRDLKLLRTLSDQRWCDVFDVTKLPNGDVALAGRGGLYHLTVTGKTKTAISNLNGYTSSVIVDEKLFAYCWSPPRLIFYTMQNDRWETRDTISLAHVVTGNAFVTLGTANGKIFACSDHDAKVFVLSQSGQVLQTHGKLGPDRAVGLAGVLNIFTRSDKTRLGQAGGMIGPHLCAVDSEELMLVADSGNDRLQVCDVSGQWGVLDLQPAVKEPVGAAVIDNKLYVCSFLENTLSVFASE